MSALTPKRVLVLATRVVLLCALGVCVLLLGCQSRMIYFPRAYQTAETRYWVVEGGAILDYTTAQGRQQAFFRPGSDPAGPIWLFFPGNAMLALEASSELRNWDSQAGWLLVDYPGYGSNEGRPHPSTVAQNITSAVDALSRHLGVSVDSLRPRLGAAGQSLGAAAALMAAEILGLDRVVVLAPFTTLTEMGRRSVGWPLCHLNRHRYDNRRTLRAVTERGGRIWIVHGIEDEFIPVAMARELAALAPSRVKLWEIPGGTHNDLWYTAAEPLKRVFDEARAR